MISDKYLPLIGKKILSIQLNGGGHNYIDDAEITFHLEGDQKLRIFHAVDCCESVTLTKVPTNLCEMLGKTLDDIDCNIYSNEDTPEDLEADRNPGVDPYDEDSHTWTIVVITCKGEQYRFIWLGESNGYYCEIPSSAVNDEKDYPWGNSLQ